MRKFAAIGAAALALIGGGTTLALSQGSSTAPGLSGAPVVGQTLHASQGSWGNSPTSFAYQWQRCASTCSNIPGATASTYVVASADAGDSIDVIVTASNIGGSASQTSAHTAVVAPVTTAGIHVVGNRLQNAAGQTVRLIGTDVSGSSYGCEQGFGFSDTPTGSSLYTPMLSWKINSVTLGLNQDCWLGINGVPSQFAGQNYVNYVKGEVTAMEKVGIYPVLAFFVGEPGADAPNWGSTGNGNAPMPDNDHVPLFWERVANTFKSDPNVIFRLYEEPWPEFFSAGTSASTWKCWSKGDVQYQPSGDSTSPPTPSSSTQNCNPLNSDAQGTDYKAVGMQSLVNIIRGTGATNVIQIPGVAFADALSCDNTSSPVSCGFLAAGVRVTDTLSSPQLMADTDNYPDSGQFISTVAQVQATYGPVEQVMPIDMGEAGTVTNSFTTEEAFIGQYDTWGQSYYLSQWETWASLITSYSTGKAGPGFGTWAFNHITAP